MLSKYEHLHSFIFSAFMLISCKISYIPTSRNFLLNAYKYLQSLTFASCVLNQQLQAPTSIFINKVLSVSYCSTVMMYDVFNSLSCILLCALPSASWKGSEILVNRGKYTTLEWRLGGGQPTIKFNTFVQNPKGCLCTLTFCNYKYLNISLFPSSALFYKLICHETD